TLINFSIRAETVLRGVDASLDDGRFYLVDGLRPERQTFRDLLSRVRRDEFVVLAHRHDHEELIRLRGLYNMARYGLAHMRGQQLQLLTARAKCLATVQQLVRFFSKAFVCDEPDSKTTEAESF